MNIILCAQSTNSPYIIQAINVLVNQYESLNFLGAVQFNALPIFGRIIINGESLPIINKSDLPYIDYDLIVVTGQDASLVPILKEAEELKLDPDKLVLDRTICIPGFTPERYKKLRNSKLSILSINCWGGLTYHTFGLPFLSPTINMFASEKDFLMFLSDPKYYMDKELRFYKTKFEPNLNWNYPVFLLGDIVWNMNHYGDVGIDGARQKWEERRLKINWYNLLVMTITEEPMILEEFDKLPYAKKVCFVPFETQIDSGFYIEPEIVAGREFHQSVNETSMGFMNYDLWDLLLYGKKTPIQFIRE